MFILFCVFLKLFNMILICSFPLAVELYYCSLIFSRLKSFLPHFEVQNSRISMEYFSKCFNKIKFLFEKTLVYKYPAANLLKKLRGFLFQRQIKTGILLSIREYQLSSLFYFIFGNDDLLSVT